MSIRYVDAGPSIYGATKDYTFAGVVDTKSVAREMLEMSGPRNTLSDLNNHLFEQLERLGEVDEETLTIEIDRSKAVANIAKNIIDNGKLALEAEKFMDDKLDENRVLPRMLVGDKNGWKKE